jgi:DNA-binding transcriptional LysR family regulator
MELRHLRTFLVVAETLNISEAARRLRATQPALSRQIRELESNVGHPLFSRRSNGLRLTASGEALRDHGLRAVSSVDQALERAREAGDQEEAVLRVGYYTSVCIWANILGPAFQKLSRMYPKAVTRLYEAAGSELMQSVAKGDLDIALLGPGDFRPAPGVTVAVACSVPAMVMMPTNHRLAKKRHVTVEDLRGERILGLSEDAAPQRDRTFAAACKAAGFAPRVEAAGSGLPELMVAVGKNTAVSIVDAFVRLAPLPGVALVRFKPPGVTIDIMAAYRDECSPPVRRLVELALAQARRVAPLV